MNNFAYLQPKSLAEASKWLSEGRGHALPNGGGTDLLDLIKEGIEQPEYLVNLKNVPGLDRIEYRKGKGLRIGSLAKIAEIAGHPDVRGKFAALAEAAGQVGSPQLRNVGTIGGNLCQRPRCWYFRSDFDCIRKGGDLCFATDGQNRAHCIIGGGPCFIVHPSDTAVALTTLGASVKIQSADSTREVALRDFFVLPEVDPTHETILEPGEILTEIIVPEPARGAVSGYTKFTMRDVWDFAIVSVAAVLVMDGKKRIASGNVALGGVAPVPWIEREAGAMLAGMTVTEENLKALANATLKDAYPLDKNEYKLPLARNLIRRLIGELTA